MLVAEGSFKFPAEAIFTTQAILTGMTHTTCPDNLLTLQQGRRKVRGIYGPLQHRVKRSLALNRDRRRKTLQTRPPEESQISSRNNDG